MAGSSPYQDSAGDDNGITDINVTPFVDVVLVLLVVFMVTAKLIVARGVEIDKPKNAKSGEVPATLRISVNKDGLLYVNGTPYARDEDAVERVRVIARSTDKPKAVIAGDRTGAYDNVMRAISIAQRADVTAIALETERP